MKNQKLLRLIFMALCCDLGLFAKRIIAPFANILTDSLHIPGGIGTAFSLLFLVVAAAIIPKFGAATLMGAVQSILALAFGMVGSMGALAPIGYIVPGIVIDTVLLLGRRFKADEKLSMMLANMLGSVSAGLTANIIVFRLPAIPLALYASVALFSGAICGLLAAELYRRVAQILGRELRKDI
ncbi:MAG: ECF transporter S component [Firmicutes bacterium]|nr:ECF transporter S component [Bacillota bacterium]